MQPRDPQALAHLLATYSRLSDTPDGSYVQLSIERREAPSISGVLLRAIGGPSRSTQEKERGPPPETVAILCAARENVMGGTLILTSRYSDETSTLDLVPGELCLFDADVQVVKGPTKPCDIDFDAWEDFVVLRTRHA
jgi:hypothetical protein